MTDLIFRTNSGYFFKKQYCVQMVRRNWLVCLMVILWIPQLSRAQSAPNHVLQMTGVEPSARIQDDVLNGLTSCTIEAWIKWDDFNQFSQPWSFGDTSNCIGINVFRSTSNLQLFAYEGTGTANVARAHNAIKLHQWYHIAAVIAPELGLKLYINGVLAAENPNPTSEPQLIAGSGPAWLGVSPWETNGRFNGALDELRIWNHARTHEQIRDGMSVPTLGTEEGLKCFWNFEPDSNSNVPTLNKPLELTKDLEFVLLDWGTIINSPRQWILHGIVRNEAGRFLPDAIIRIQNEQAVLNQVTSNPDGSFAMILEIGESEKLELIANHATRGIRTTIEVNQNRLNGRIRQDVILKPSLNLRGSVFSMDNTPLDYVLIEAVPENSDSKTKEKPSLNSRYYAWSNSAGVYQFSNLPAQSYRLRAHLPKGWVGLKLNINAVSGLSPDMVPNEWQAGSLIDVKADTTVRNLNFHLPHFRKARSTNFDLLNNLNEVEIRCVELDSFGRLWVGLEKGGLAVSAESQFENAPSDLISSDRIITLHNDGEKIWIGTNHGIYLQTGFEFNISRLAGLESLNDAEIWHISKDLNGKIWIGTNKGLFYFDNSLESKLVSIDAVKSRWIRDLLITPDGTMWLASWGNGLYQKTENGWKQWGLHEGLARIFH
jgi:hypothetical protein